MAPCAGAWLAPTFLTVRWRRGRGKGDLGEDPTDAQVADWLKVAEPLRLCGRLSVLDRAGEDLAVALEELERSEAMLRVRLYNPDIQTARAFWTATKGLLRDLRGPLQLPLGPKEKAEQTVLCWSLHVADGQAVKEVGRHLSTKNEYLTAPWAAGEKTVRERMWIASEQTTTNVTMTSLPGLVAMTEAWANRFHVDLSELSPMAARVKLDKVPPEPRPIPGDKTEWIGDVTIPDDTVMQPGQHFVKTWAIRNGGTVPWEGRYLTRIGVNNKIFTQNTPARVEIPDTQPGETVHISVPVTAPTAAGTTQVHWKQTDELGREYFPGPQYAYGVYCRIVVPQLPRAPQF